MQDKEFAAILQDEPQQPLALVPLTEEEQVSPLSAFVYLVMCEIDKVFLGYFFH